MKQMSLRLMINIFQMKSEDNKIAKHSLFISARGTTEILHLLIVMVHLK